MCHLTMPTDPFVNRRFVAIFVVDRKLLREFEFKNETCHILVPNELKNAEHLTVQLGYNKIDHSSC